MTIAACYLSTEGVVLGADSMSTVFVPGSGAQQGSEHHFNFAQKVFEFGEPGASVGVTLWGLGSLLTKSHRTIIAEAADQSLTANLPDLKQVADLVGQLYAQEYEQSFRDIITQANTLQQKGEERTKKEDEALADWKQMLALGICLGGRWGASRNPRAFEIVFDVTGPFPSRVNELAKGTPYFWGCPNLIERVLRGTDFQTASRISNSPHWQGSFRDLLQILEQSRLGRPMDLPLREAIDWMHASIYTTIKTMKFSHLEPLCGGPIEIAAVTSDRPFRWVCHKRLSEAVTTHQSPETRA